MTGRAAGRERRGDDRHRRRRVRHARLHRRLGRQRRQEAVAPHTTAAAGEKGGDTWPGDTCAEGRRTDLADRRLRCGTRPRLLGHRQRRPWNPQVRMGDNLYVCSVLAFRPKTGEIVWHYQFIAQRPVRLRRHRESACWST